ncbi:hypothetical protein GON09_005500 [Rhodococcus sp. B50]|nr:hypothetical protein [Rhodococcus sp. B50]
MHVVDERRVDFRTLDQAVQRLGRCIGYVNGSEPSPMLSDGVRASATTTASLMVLLTPPSISEQQSILAK